MPSKHHVPAPIYVIGLNGGAKLFMPIGAREGKEPTHWIMTDACVALVKCSMCDADVMQLCKFDGRECAGTHWPRRKAAIGMVPKHNVRLAKGIEHGVAPEEHW